MTETSLSSTLARPAPSPVLRWMVLVFVSVAMFGNYYIYDSISPLADLLKAQLGFSDSEIGLLNAIYSIPNIFMVVIGGFIIDRIGTKKAVFYFTALCFAGALLTATTSELTQMAVGRLVFGLGAESMIVAVTTAIAKWFRGTSLSFAFGINLSIARLGSIAALNSPTWAQSLYGTYKYPMYLAVAAGLVSLVGAVVYWIIEARAADKYDLGDEAQTDKIVWRDILKLGKSYWFIIGLCITFYSGIFPFQTFAVKFFQEAHGASRELGGFLSSTLTIFAMIFTPLFGLLVDRVGNRALFMMFGSLLLMPVYLLLAYSSISLYIPMAMMGISFSLIPAVMWPSVAYIVDQQKLGSAYGVMTAIQQVGLAGFNLLIGWANDFSHASAANPEGYNLGLWIFSALGFVGFFFAFMLRKSETGPTAHGLEYPSGKKPVE